MWVYFSSFHAVAFASGASTPRQRCHCSLSGCPPAKGPQNSPETWLARICSCMLRACVAAQPQQNTRNAADKMLFSCPFLTCPYLIFPSCGPVALLLHPLSFLLRIAPCLLVFVCCACSCAGAASCTPHRKLLVLACLLACCPASSSPLWPDKPAGQAGSLCGGWAAGLLPVS